LTAVVISEPIGSNLGNLWASLNGFGHVVAVAISEAKGTSQIFLELREHLRVFESWNIIFATNIPNRGIIVTS
jgi:hypothetical protein